MRIKGKDYRTVWYDNKTIYMIDQPKLPHRFEIVQCKTHTEAYNAVRDMTVRGAPAIGATGCFAMSLAIENYTRQKPFEQYINEVAEYLKSARPTAYDLTHGVDFILRAIEGKTIDQAKSIAVDQAQKYANDSALACKKIGQFGCKLIKDKMGILTHCNAGALATVDHGTALAPVRAANDSGKDITIYVDETRPRCQGARLTAFELNEERIKHFVIADNAAGHYIKTGYIQMVITGADRIALNGDTANKIGTYTKAVLAKENNIPFYIAAPFSTIDFNCPGEDMIPIEDRDQDEVLCMFGIDHEGEIEKIRIAPENSQAKNPAFDVTPAKYITGIIMEKGIFQPDQIKELRP